MEEIGFVTPPKDHFQSPLTISDKKKSSAYLKMNKGKEFLKWDAIRLIPYV